jgi:hypothetical protein
MIWYALLIPILAVIVGWVLFKKEIVWWELFIPTAGSILFILISYYSMKSYTLSDVEYNGYIVTEARYYEPYETWVKKTCSRTYSTGSGKHRTTHTVYYDCSYCDYNPERYTIIDTKGNEIEISLSKYKSLMKQWHGRPKFVELNRDINYHGGCGKDGDMYFFAWDKQAHTSETTTYEKSFTNILKSNHSAFNYPDITEEEAKKAGLYEYPTIENYNYQTSVVGLENTKVKNKWGFVKTLDHINGAYGSQFKVKVFTLFFKSKDINTAFLQEAYWDGGNQNEIVVCIGVDKNGKFEWVKPFSWCDDKRVLIDIREDLMSAKNPNAKVFHQTYYNAIRTHWKFKSFEDFNYLSFEPTSGQLIFVYLLTLIISVATVWWCVTNDEKE